MRKSLKLFQHKQKGQALPIVLCVLAIGSLTIAASLNYSTTSLKGTRIVKQNLDGIYAAGAGIEHTLWSIENGVTPLTLLPEQINQMAVNIQTVLGEDLITVYINNLREAGEHAGAYHVSSNITPAGGATYNYTITVTTDADAKNNAKFQELGAMLPPGYTYVANSASVNPAGNISSSNPTSTGYDGGSQWLKWLWGGNGPTIAPNMTYTEKFQITGTGSISGYYAWIIGNSEDIGVVGQITGILTTINATARRPQDGKTTARINAQAIVGSGGVYILSWRISN